MLKWFQVLEDGRICAREARNWKIARRTREENYKKGIQKIGMSSKWEDSWRRNVNRISQERKCCKTEVYCLKKKETS